MGRGAGVTTAGNIGGVDSTGGAVDLSAPTTERPLRGLPFLDDMGSSSFLAFLLEVNNSSQSGWCSDILRDA